MLYAGYFLRRSMAHKHRVNKKQGVEIDSLVSRGGEGHEIC
jgi:hypothetical protein